jgi:hypothetical protein
MLMSLLRFLATGSADAPRKNTAKAAPAAEAAPVVAPAGSVVLEGYGPVKITRRFRTPAWKTIPPLFTELPRPAPAVDLSKLAAVDWDEIEFSRPRGNPDAATVGRNLGGSWGESYSRRLVQWAEAEGECPMYEAQALIDYFLADEERQAIHAEVVKKALDACGLDTSGANIAACHDAWAAAQPTITRLLDLPAA